MGYCNTLFLMKDRRTAEYGFDGCGFLLVMKDRRIGEYGFVRCRFFVYLLFL
jgi:hypothetical protein